MFVDSDIMSYHVKNEYPNVTKKSQKHIPNPEDHHPLHHWLHPPCSPRKPLWIPKKAILDALLAVGSLPIIWWPTASVWSEKLSVFVSSPAWLTFSVIWYNSPNFLCYRFLFCEVEIQHLSGINEEML